MSRTPYPAMMFAAGFGTRMKALTQDRPKPLIEVAGITLFDRALALVRDAGCDPVVANLHYKSAMMAHHLDPLGVQTIVETPDILETGGGLRNALPVLERSPVVTTNTDAVWDGPNPIDLLQRSWDPARMDALLICIPRESAVGYEGTGDFLLSENGSITRGPGLIYGGVQLIKTDALPAISEKAFSLNLLWDRMLGDGRLFGLRYPGRWCDVGHPAGITLAEDMLEQRDV